MVEKENNCLLKISARMMLGKKIYFNIHRSSMNAIRYMQKGKELSFVFGKLVFSFQIDLRNYYDKLTFRIRGS